MKELVRASKQLCFCGSGKPYEDCCGMYHQGHPAPTAEALMRSRYSAFVVKDADYLLRTWHETTRPSTLAFDDIKWLRLKILKTQRISQTEARVTFVARGLISGRGFSQQEDSRFVFENGQWFYIDGIVE